MSRPTLFGVTTSALRMAFGGHFFTDVAAAGLVTFLVIWLAHGFIYRWPSTRLSDESIDAALTRLGWPEVPPAAEMARPRCGTSSVGVNACARDLSACNHLRVSGKFGIQFNRIFMSKDVKKVVLAYSGGLDTSIILKWLQTTYGCEVVTFTADLGQGEELEPARQKALLLGIKPENIFIEDLREEFVRDYVFPMFRANAVYEGQYLLGTSIARPLIAKKQIEIAEKVGADAVSHGATGKGNDQVRFELAYYALKPDVTIIAPWREWDLRSREQLIAFAEAHQIPIAKDKRGEAPFSVDANLLHASSEGKVLEDPAQEVPDYVYSRTIDPEKRAGQGDHASRVDFERGRCDRDRRQEAVARDAAGEAQRTRPRQRHRPARSRREPFRRHEVARHVRDAGRHHSARSPSRHRDRSRSIAARRISRTS